MMLHMVVSSDESGGVQGCDETEVSRSQIG